MSENSKVQTSVTELVLLTGGLITSGAAGWSLFRMFKSQQINYQELMYLFSFAGGVGILSSAIFFKYRKFSDSQRKSITSKKDASNKTVPVWETSAPDRLLHLLDRVNEWDKIFAHEAKAVMGEVFNEEIPRNMEQEADEISSKYKELTTRLNYLNQQRQINELQNLLADNQFKTCFNEGIGSSKAKLKEEITAHIKELKGHVLGTIDPHSVAKNILFQSTGMNDEKYQTSYNEGIGSSKAKLREEITARINELKGHVRGMVDPHPLPKNIQFQSTWMDDEKYRQFIIIVKEYAITLLIKLQNVIDEFVYSVCEAEKVLNNKEHEVKNVLETEEDLSRARLKIELSQFYSDFEKAMKSESQIPSCQNGPRCRNVSGASARPLESVPTDCLDENFRTAESNDAEIGNSDECKQTWQTCARNKRVQK